MHRAQLLLIALLGAAFLVAPAAQGASPDIVVSQVYGGGGNSGATYQNDFVELFNRGGAAVDLSGWSIQYATAAGTSWSATALSGSVAPGRHYLVQLASAAAVGSALPTPDATGTTNLAASGGKVALAESATPLGCGATAGSCSAAVGVHDLPRRGRVLWRHAVDVEELERDLDRLTHARFAELRHRFTSPLVRPYSTRALSRTDPCFSAASVTTPCLRAAMFSTQRAAARTLTIP